MNFLLVTYFKIVDLVKYNVFETKEDMKKFIKDNNLDKSKYNKVLHVFKLIEIDRGEL